MHDPSVIRRVKRDNVTYFTQRATEIYVKKYPIIK